MKSISERKMTVTEICERLEISRATYYKYLRIGGLARKVRPYGSKNNYRNDIGEIRNQPDLSHGRREKYYLFYGFFEVC